MFRRASYYRASSEAVPIAEAVISAAKRYLELYPHKTLLHASQDKAIELRDFALKYKNIFNALETPLEEMSYLVDFLRSLDERLELIKKQGKSTLFDLFAKNASLEKQIREAVATCIGDHPTLTTHELTQKLLEEFGGDLRQFRR